jgi:hypothetical protein
MHPLYFFSPFNNDFKSLWDALFKIFETEVEVIPIKFGGLDAWYASKNTF